MENLIIRTEDIKTEYILDLFVETHQDKEIVDKLKSSTPTILEGSRGTGKSFLFRVAEMQLHKEFEQKHVLPIYVSFIKSSLLQSGDNNQFIHWMMAKLCSRIIRVLYQKGYIVKPNQSLITLAGGEMSTSLQKFPLETLAEKYEESYKNPGVIIDSSAVPAVDDFKDAIEDICRAHGMDRIAIFFDEAAHIFRPEQQRQFFTLFRDLRSPFISCNAAVYPGVTFYGQTFQTTHDATVLTLNRNPFEPGYLDGMKNIVLTQADAELTADIEKNRKNFQALAYAVSGNPRLLLKTVTMAPKLKTNDVARILKEFYRTEIWAEHSGLVGRYGGHRALIDWGREFIEKSVIPESNKKNEQWLGEGKKESTCFFWIHRDAPAVINESLRLLSYTGIVTQLESGIVATRREIGTRYAVNLGCIAAPLPDPIDALSTIGRNLSIKRFTEYGANHALFKELTSTIKDFKENDISTVLTKQLERSIDFLDISPYQKSGLKAINIDTVGKALLASEYDFQKINYVGPIRSRRIMNVVTASVLEYLSG